MRYKFSFILSMMFSMIIHENGLACSSCGSGGDDPLILYPSDNTRLYLGATRTDFQQNISPSGDYLRVTGIRQQEKLLLSVGQRISSKSFFAISVPQVTNYGKTSSETGVGDPALAFRYTAVRQNFLDPIIPQVQILAGFTPSYAKSVQNAEDQREYLDAFGTGHSTMRLGLDIWSGMALFNYGIGINYLYPFARTYNEIEMKPGNTLQTNATVGIFYKKARFVTGFVRSQSQERREDGEVIADSEKIQHNLFYTLSYRPEATHEGRITLVDAGRVFQNKNTTRNNIVTAAYIYSL